MQKRHEASLRDAIDALAATGTAALSKDLMRLWYGQERLSKAVWRDIRDKLPEDWTEKRVTVFATGDRVILLDRTRLSPLEDMV